MRFVKTPGSIPLPPGVSRQFKVFSGEESLDGAPAMTFDLDKAHMRGVTSIHLEAGPDWSLGRTAKVGTGSWDLTSETGVCIGRVLGRGSLKKGWKLELPGGGVDYELADPDSVARQTVRAMLGGDTEALVLLENGVLAGTLTRKHRDQSQGKKAGLLAGLKRFVTGRDWVLDIQQQNGGRELAGRETLIALASLGLVAIVNLDLSTAD
ncbi:hypothetical protein [Roseibium aggregatum]|uniref:hypothetical protein n=1 Tax=Roseibium aggregatum TaxID=187304 RepID=UPI00058E688D|nr:hypothetical protein [Roseibium aggregatum]